MAGSYTGNMGVGYGAAEPLVDGSDVARLALVEAKTTLRTWAASRKICIVAG